MRGRTRSRFFRVDVAVVMAVAVVVLALGLVGSSRLVPDEGTSSVTVTQHRLAHGRAMPDGFLGFSLEYSAVPAYGGDPSALNPVFEQLVRNLTPGQRPSFRIGGNSADWTWSPVPGMARPPGVTYTLGPSWLRVTRALVHALGGHVILGLNLAADSPEVAATEARVLIDGIGKSSVQALELGNEPELYGGFAWYRTPDGRPVTARSRSYDFAAFLRDFTNVASALPAAPLAGPNTGGPAWMSYLQRFLRAQPRVSLVTMHRYPLQLCYSTPGSARYPTIKHLLSSAASSGLANGFRRAVTVAHSHGFALRVDELNSVSCGAAPAISQTFASALWALDALFEMARVGVDGVNLHTFPGAGYELFKFSRTGVGWTASIAPEYYGLMMFEQAAPPGSQLLRISGARNGQVKVWATLAPDRRVRVVVINKSSRGRGVTVRVPGATGPASLELLTAPSVRATTGVMLGGQSFGSSTETGTLQGAPQTALLRPARGSFTIRFLRAGAALLTLGALGGS